MGREGALDGAAPVEGRRRASRGRRTTRADTHPPPPRPPSPPPGAASLIGSLQAFKVKYAEARAKEHPELQAVYAAKIAAMQAAGVLFGCC